MEKSPLTRIGKADYAARLGINRTALCRMLNIEFYAELRKVGYTKHQKYLTQAQIERLEYLAVNIAD